MNPAVANEARLCLSHGLLTASIKLLNADDLELPCDRAEATPEGDLLLFNPSGLILAAIARGQWISCDLQQPKQLHCRPHAALMDPIPLA